METEQVAVQPTVGSIAQTPQNAFVVPNGELKDFYLKFALLLNPEFLLRKPYRIRTLKHSSERLEKIVGALTHLTMHAWDDGIPEILLSCGAYSLQDDLNKKHVCK